MEDERIEKNDEELNDTVVESEGIASDDMSNDDNSFTYRIDNGQKSNKNYNYDDKKSFLYIAIGLIVLIGIIFVLVKVANSKKGKNAGYSNIESKMVSAAKSYYKKNSDKLPLDDNSISVSIETLVENNNLKPISEMVKDGVSCSGYVTVYKNSEDYVYFPYLNCGSDYESKRLNNKIIEDSLVTSGDGLYKNDEDYIFRGEYPNNYVEFDDSNWRIVKINSDGSIKLLNVEKKINRKPWDDRYNSSKSGYVGINDFRVSRILEFLQSSYEKNTYVSSSNKDLLVKSSWCIGKISSKDAPIASLDVCSDVYDDLYIGLLNVNEVLISSISEKCINMYDTDCTNYNYFFKINTGWTLNASSEDTYSVFSTNDGSVSVKKASLAGYVKPVININSNVLYKSGTGTSDDPYIIGD